MKAGNETAGYELRVDAKDAILRLEVWGIWDDALAASYGRDMRTCYGPLEGRSWFALADIRRFPAQKQSVAAVHGELMGEAVARGMKRACSVVESSLTKMQIRRLAEESRMPELSFFIDENAARTWLLS